MHRYGNPQRDHKLVWLWLLHARTHRWPKILWNLYRRPSLHWTWKYHPATGSIHVWLLQTKPPSANHSEKQNWASQRLVGLEKFGNCELKDEKRFEIWIFPFHSIIVKPVWKLCRLFTPTTSTRPVKCSTAVTAARSIIHDLLAPHQVPRPHDTQRQLLHYMDLKAKKTPLMKTRNFTSWAWIKNVTAHTRYHFSDWKMFLLCFNRVLTSV